MQAADEIAGLIPHRPPFVWVDRIISCTDDSILTEKDISPDLDLFRGHYPGNPIMPGVLLCEALFQSGALLMARRNRSDPGKNHQFPVLTRIGGAKFKRQVRPGDTVRMQVTLTEMVSTACFFKGTLRVDDKIAVQVDFVCAMVGSSP
jgi:3-hydroxyacyl-[acyl-carrier-protein] dehydratase